MTHVSEHDLWTTGSNRVATMAPGPDDLFVVALMFGKRVFAWPIYEYERAVEVAQQFARRLPAGRRVTIKVLPMTADEFLAFTGVTHEQVAEGLSPADAEADRQLAINACQSVLLNSPDAAARADAHDLLKRMGVMP